MQSGRENTLEERYAIKFCFKLGKKDAKETDWMLQTSFGASCRNRASVSEWHKRFKEGRESVRDDEMCGRSRLTKGLGLGLLCWGFKGVQEEFLSEEASTLPFGSVAFPARQCTSPQLHPFHRLFDQYGQVWILLMLGWVLERGCPRGVMFKAIDCGIVVSSYSSCAITFTFGQIPLWKVWTPLSSQLRVNSTSTVFLGEWLWH